MDEAQSQVADLLEHFGYSSRCIPEGEQESADVFASAGDDVLLVEVKSRVDDIDLARELGDVPTGEPVFDSMPVRRAEPEARIARKARSQLLRSRDEFKRYDSIWIVGPDGLPRFITAYPAG